MPENLNVDIYSNDGKANTLHYNGRLTTKLSVISDPKKIKEYYKEQSFKNISNSPEKINSPDLSLNTSSPALTQSIDSSASKKHISPKKVKGNPYKVSISDSPSLISQKLIQLLALGPITESSIIEKLNMTWDRLKPLMSDYTQLYNPRDSFTQDDKYPSLERFRRKAMRQSYSNTDIESGEWSSDDSDSQLNTESEAQTKYILKDKSYKEFQPWNWSFYSSFELNLITQNVHRALTRLGYSESHPLRKKLFEESSDDDKKVSRLGGGFLISKSKKQNSLRAPLKVERKTNSNAASTISPVRSQTPSAIKSLTPVPSTSSSTNGKRTFSLSSNSSTSDDEKHLKKLKINDSDTSPSSDEDNVPLSRRAEVKNDSPDTHPPEIKSASKRLEYYNNLAVKFKMKYNEYEILYNQLKNPKTGQNKSENKKQLLKLFELHNTLSQWKKTLWDFDDETKRKSNIMNLSKHKKVGSSNATSPFIAKLQSDGVVRSQSASPAPPSKPQSPLIASRFTSRPSSSASKLVSTAVESLKPRPKLPLNY